MPWRNYSMHLKHINMLKESISRRCMIYAGLLLSCPCSNLAHPALLKQWTLSMKKRWITNSSRLNPWKHADIQLLRTPPIKLNHHPWNCLSYRQTTPDRNLNMHTVPPNTPWNQSLPWACHKHQARSLLERMNWTSPAPVPQLGAHMPRQNLNKRP